MQKDTQATIKGMLKNIKNEDHLKVVKDYLEIRKRIDKVKDFTLKNDVQALLSLSSFLGSKPYNKVSQNDMLKFEDFLQNKYTSNAPTSKDKKGLSQTTVELYEVRIKRFYKYLSDPKTYRKGKRFQKNIPYPDNVSWISTSSNNHMELPLDYIFDDKQILKLLQVCDNARDQAMITVLYDGGLRIGELIDLNVKNIGFDKLGAYILLPKKGMDLKTGTRKIRMFILPTSVQYLKTYINTHPFKDHADAPLFYSRKTPEMPYIIDRANNGTITEKDIIKLRLSRSGIEGLIKSLGKFAKLPVSLTPHTLRHNSATKCAKLGFNEMELRIRFGWSSTSKMPSRYTHLASKDVDDKIKIILGYEEPTKQDSILQAIVCWNCQEENVPTNKFCSRCGTNLNPTKEEIKIDATTTGITTQEMLKDPQFREFYNEMLLATWEKYKQMKEK